MRHGILLLHMKCPPTNRSFLSQPRRPRARVARRAAMSRRRVRSHRIRSRREDVYDETYRNAESWVCLTSG